MQRYSLILDRLHEIMDIAMPYIHKLGNFIFILKGLFFFFLIMCEDRRIDQWFLNLADFPSHLGVLCTKVWTLAQVMDGIIWIYQSQVLVPFIAAAFRSSQ